MHQNNYNMNIAQEISKGESSVPEFKKELPATHEQYLKTVVAFAKGKGGHIIFGVEDQTCAVVGVQVESVARTLARISNAIVDGIVPQVIPDIYPGKGIKRIFDAFRESGLPLPEYRVDETSVTVVVPCEYSHETGERLFGHRNPR